ncbi:MAG TPA: MauE/DoxX family redox-associated membrane protein [Ktedonobacterales bacterium]
MTASFYFAVSVLGSALLAGVFLAAALPKLRSPRAFAMTVVEYRILPLRASLILARLLPPLELLAAMLLLAGIVVRWTAVLLALMLASFSLAIAINLARGRELDCGCFGVSAKRVVRRVSASLLMQDAALLGVALVVSIAAPAGLSLSSWSLVRLLGNHTDSPMVPLIALATCILVAVAVAVALGGPSHTSGRRSVRDRLSAGPLAARATQPGRTP